MYSDEIAEFLKAECNYISADDYVNIIRQSPQIDHVIFNPYTDVFSSWTTDGYCFNFQVHR